MKRLKFHFFEYFTINNANRILFIGLVLTISLNTLAQKKQSARWYFDESDKAIQSGDWKKALIALDECIRLSPGLAEAYYSRGMAREQLGDFQGAITDYNIYTDLKPDHYDALFSKAVLHYNLAQYEMAKVDFLRIRKLPQQETTTIFFKQDAFEKGADLAFTSQGTGPHFIFNYLGLIYTKLKDYPTAIQYLDSAINFNRDESDYLVNRGVAKEASGDYSAALTDYRLALKADPNNALAKRNITTITDRTGQIETATDTLINEAINSAPHLPYTYAARAYQRSQQKNWKGAIEDYTKAIAIDSANKDYYYNRGIVKENVKDWEGAQKDYIKAISIKEDFVKAWFSHGNVSSKLNQLSEAIEDYTVVLFYDPNNASAYYNRGICTHRLNKGRNGCEDILKAEELGFKLDVSIKKSLCK